ncbi:MAG: sulfite exporter TauE/SafE family protein [Gammaproteobacteria bacterium]|nr:sulfite exporter TauE/SafE family protein [Gammaproteobacteria bacterium]
MFDAITLVIIATFLLAGLVKCVIGLGLPTVSLAILTMAIDLPTAMVLLLVPSFVTNLWQAFGGRDTRAVLARIWPFLLAAALTVWIGIQALRLIELALLSALLGALIAIYSGASLGGLRFSISKRLQGWAGPVLGLINGILTGMTGSFVVPGVMYLQAIGLGRDALMQAMGMLFAISTLALGLALQGNDFLSVELGVDSTLALLPALVGMAIGQRVRRAVPERQFRIIFFAALLLLGAYLFYTALSGYYR